MLNQLIIFQCDCIRKHTILDQRYVLSLFPNQITLNQVTFLSIYNQLNKDPKYIVPLSLNNWIEWNLNTQNQFDSFTIEYSGKIKSFHATHEDLKTLKTHLRNKIMFRSINSLYLAKSQLGEEYAEIYLSDDKITNEQYAIRCLQKYQFNDNMKSVYNEIACLSEINSQYVQRLIEVYQGENAIYLVQEPINGSNLFDIIHYIKLDEIQIRSIMKQLITGLNDIHQKEIVHRDIKPSNIMFKHQDNLDELKIIDFSLATKLGQQKSMKQTGTPGFIAPEVFKDFANYNSRTMVTDKADMFSAGCIFYRLLTNRDLFSGRSSTEIMKLNRACLIDYKILQLYKIPDPAMALLQGLLELNPFKRLSAEEALDQLYLQNVQSNKSTPIQQSQRQNCPINLISLDEYQVDFDQPTISKLPTFKVLKHSSVLKQMQTNRANRMLKKSGTQHYDDNIMIQVHQSRKSLKDEYGDDDDQQ